MNGLVSIYLDRIWMSLSFIRLTPRIFTVLSVSFWISHIAGSIRMNLSFPYLYGSFWIYVIHVSIWISLDPFLSVHTDLSFIWRVRPRRTSKYKSNVQLEPDWNNRRESEIRNTMTNWIQIKFRETVDTVVIDAVKVQIISSLSCKIKCGAKMHVLREHVMRTEYELVAGSSSLIVAVNQSSPNHTRNCSLTKNSPIA